MAAYFTVSLLAFFAYLPFSCAICPNDDENQTLDLGAGECKNASSNIYCGHLYQSAFFPNNVADTLQKGLNVVADYFTAAPSCSRNTLSRYVTLQVCLAVQPICEPSEDGAPPVVRPPCRDLCLQVAADCGSGLQTVGDTECLFSDCNRWPETNCIGLHDPLVTKHVPVITTTTPTVTRLVPTPTVTVPPLTATATPLPVNESSCPLETQTYFTDAAKTFAKGWVAFWSVLCFISTLLTLLTFCLDSSRFQYPWRPLVYLALSFHIHTLGYFLAFIIGSRSVTCPGGSYVETDGKWTWSHTPCILVFGLLYYSMVAAFLWWFILSLSWFLSSVYKWTNEAISQFALFYHVAAWVLPLVLTISVLAVRVVSADELTGTCFIVRTDTNSSFLALLLALIIPLSLLLLLGSVFLFIGFISLLQIRKFMVHRGKARESVILEKLMLRIGVYVAIYIIPAAVLIGCFLYEIETRPRWHTVSDPCTNCSRPNTAVFMVRVFMFLLIGVLTGVWICSKKTLQSWKMMPAKLRNCAFPVAERAQDTDKEATKLSSFNSGHRPVSGPSPSYPYVMDSGPEYSA
jgi:hypothetical protein